MNHTEAVNMQAADRYLLGELSESESSDFEEHYFVCVECAAELESGAILVENTRAALEEMRPAPVQASAFQRLLANLRKPLFAIPSFATCMLACVCAYQAFLLIPQLKQEAAAGKTAMALPSFALAGRTRGAEATLKAPRAASFIAVAFDPDPQMPYPQYRCELQDAGGKTLLTVMAAPPSAGEPVTILLPARELKAGNYRLAVAGVQPDGKTAGISDYGFALEFR
jgi:hypothetical protein